MWEQGTIGNCEYSIKHFAEKSKFGVNSGRISKITIRVNGKITCNYDRGWDIRPYGKETKKIFKTLIKKYN